MRENLLVLLVALGMTVPVPGSEPQEPEVPKTALQEFHHTVGEIHAQAVNAGSKLRNGAVSVGTGAEDTPAQLCCARNIDKIAKHIQQLAARIQSLRSCYQANGDADGEVQLNFVTQDASSLNRAMGNFVNARNEADVQSGYGAVSKSLLLLQKSAKDLTECEPSVPD